MGAIQSSKNTSGIPPKRTVPMRAAGRWSSTYSTPTYPTIKYNSPMPKLMGLESIVTELRAERGHLVNNLRHVDAALAVLGKLEEGKFATESRRTVSASARRKMAAAQKARWAKTKHQSTSAGGAGGSRPKKHLSEATRRKIAAAQRARWAKIKSK